MIKTQFPGWGVWPIDLRDLYLFYYSYFPTNMISFLRVAKEFFEVGTPCGDKITLYGSGRGCGKQYNSTILVSCSI